MKARRATVATRHGVKLLNAWTWGKFIAKRCPGCGCTPEAPCTIELPDGAGQAHCVPAGPYRMRVCSKCLLAPHVAEALDEDPGERRCG